MFINGFSALTSDGLYSKSGLKVWDNDQCGPRDLKRSQVQSQLFASFGKLNIPDKLAFGSASLALTNHPPLESVTTGVVLAIPGGSHSTDMNYLSSVRNGFPSPALFSATLPSSPISDITIFFQLKGPNRVFCGHSGAVLAALDSAQNILQTRKALCILFIAVWEDLTIQHKTQIPDDCSIALLISSQPGENTIMEITSELEGNQFSPGNIASKEKIIFMQIINALLKNEPLKISVSEPGFTGYIYMSERSF